MLPNCTASTFSYCGNGTGSEQRVQANGKDIAKTFNNFI